MVTVESEKLERSDKFDQRPGNECIGFLTPSGKSIGIGGAGHEAATSAGTTLHAVMQEGTARLYAAAGFLGIEIRCRPTDKQVLALLRYAATGLYNQMAIDVTDGTRRVQRAVHFDGLITAAEVRRLISEAFDKKSKQAPMGLPVFIKFSKAIWRNRVNLLPPTEREGHLRVWDDLHRGE